MIDFSWVLLLVKLLALPRLYKFGFLAQIRSDFAAAKAVAKGKCLSHIIFDNYSLTGQRIPFFYEPQRTQSAQRERRDR